VLSILIPSSDLCSDSCVRIVCLPHPGWHGVVFLRAGQYKNAAFKFVILIPDEYPEEPPRVYFTSRIFHPCIDPSTGATLLDHLSSY
jgi:hypothetical protein